MRKEGRKTSYQCELHQDWILFISSYFFLWIKSLVKSAVQIQWFLSSSYTHIIGRKHWPEQPHTMPPRGCSDSLVPCSSRVLLHQIVRGRDPAARVCFTRCHIVSRMEGGGRTGSVAGANLFTWKRAFRC